MPETTGTKQAAGRFRPGQSGNPAGRPRGSRHAALAALDAIGEKGAMAVLRKVVSSAKRGDLRAAEILLRRLWPEGKGRPVTFTLPTLQQTADVVTATAAIAAAVAAGELTPDEGQAVAAVLETHRRAIETEELERRLAALEMTMKGET